ncbi:SDR family oxidoreductase [Lysinibacillus sphaericus]|uniref:Dehydrogenase n=3 Tax=Lysinibacillus TaxID=400634 RepID=A0A2S5CZ30_LYSSH|nr:MULTISPECIES: SDR family oxidoreductase [Lysinibacillus]AHN22183.1 oxidoreductase [Lysinibacillus varians]AVK96579.1 oxidoreductase [Lysinibacillus sphaericus]MCS1383703.1 SDR family oxidoreductase [Lysinibacillus sphaericus]MED4542890.1 SDR family oxidoreductase [Lysinibacillus sphaericus]OEC00750.1 oxidoreductase [Lysinibacillus sphaericus]
MGKLQDKVVIITGGAGGIGSGMAKAMVKEGAIVTIVDLNEETGKAMEKELQKISPKSMFLQANLMDRANLHKIIDTVVEKYGKLDVLVNNAHASKQATIEDTTQADLDLSFDTGFYPTFYLMQAALPHLKETKGNIINFASGAGIAGHETQGAYAAAKEAIRGISRVAANEWGRFGINVNLISPIANSPGVQAWAKAQPEYYEAVKNKIPMGRFGDVEDDIGRVAVFLASEDSQYITGQTLMVDGGSIMLH